MHLFATGAKPAVFSMCLNQSCTKVTDWLYKGRTITVKKNEGWYIRVFPQRESEELLVVALTSRNSFSRLRVPGNNDSYKKHKRKIVIFRC